MSKCKSDIRHGGKRVKLRGGLKGRKREGSRRYYKENLEKVKVSNQHGPIIMKKLEREERRWAEANQESSKKVVEEARKRIETKFRRT